MTGVPIDEDNYYQDPEEKDRLREEKKRQEILSRRDDDDILWVLSNAKGRRVCTFILASGKYWASTFVSGGTEGQRQTDFNEGMREQSIILAQRINKANPEALLQMHREFLGEQLKDRKKQGDKNG